MEDLAEYHGPISKRQAEEMLNEAGRDGSYLIRDSTSSAVSYCVCVLCDGWIYTYRIFKQKDGFWTIEVECFNATVFVYTRENYTIYFGLQKYTVEFFLFVMAPGIKERLFRNVRNLIAAFKIPGQGISVPFLYPVTKTNP